MDELHKVKVTLMVDFDPEAVNGMAPFEEYVREAGVKGLLPDRWTEDNMEACIKYSVETTNWSSLGSWVEKQDLINHYGPVGMVTQLWFFAWQCLAASRRVMRRKWR
jgi:hypothetical protein